MDRAIHGDFFPSSTGSLTFSTRINPSSSSPVSLLCILSWLSLCLNFPSWSMLPHLVLICWGRVFSSMAWGLLLPSSPSLNMLLTEFIWSSTFLQYGRSGIFATPTSLSPIIPNTVSYTYTVSVGAYYISNGTSTSIVIISKILQDPAMTTCLLVFTGCLLSPEMSNLHLTLFTGNISIEGTTSLRPIMAMERELSTTLGLIEI